ncbi:hypothetical protein NPIL_350661 [Nephila pilipes]|uniref:Uncharacterized protein n=1 Tax=Nephila pilipes TaxID=299642 RepID=A0A8X6ICF2_NEPPI|nr:hypothetical protein NPIL_350661 [Nephila pilipes]
MALVIKKSPIINPLFRSGRDCPKLRAGKVGKYLEDRNLQNAAINTNPLKGKVPITLKTNEWVTDTIGIRRGLQKRHDSKIWRVEEK